MRTSVTRTGWRRVVAGAAAVAVPLALVAFTAVPAQAFKPAGSPAELMFESSVSGNLNNAIQHGWFGHEGNAAAPTGTNPTVLSADYTSGQLQAAFTNPDDNLRVVFVPQTSSGASEHPVATTGQTVDQVFGPNARFADQGLFAGLNGTGNANDSVLTVSTGAEFDAWFGAGQPLQGYNNNLQLIDIGPNTVSATPQGKSVLDAWPAGTQLSMVFYETNGSYTNGKPQVLAGADGHAKTAWLNFTTVGSPSSALRTSAGYNVTSFGAIPQNTHTTLSTSVPGPVAAGTAISLTATVAPNTGTNVPAGSVEFFDGATSLGTGTLVGGTFTKTGVVLPVGSGHSLTAVYTPTNTATLAFNTSTSSPAIPFVVNGISTTTSAAATPGADYTAPVSFTATVTPTPGVTGSVVWKEGGTTVAGPSTIDPTTGLATGTHTFTVGGDHVITAFFTPDAASTNYSASQSSPITVTLANPANVSVDQQSITATIPAGSLVVSTPYTAASPLNITGTGPSGALALNTATDVPGAAALTGFFGTANFQHINVFDTRAGALPWTLTAQAGAMVSGSHSINGENLGLTGLAPETTNVAPNRNNNAGLGVITTTNNPVPVAPVSPTDAGSGGLGGIPHTVLAENFGPADAWYSGLLTLFAPITTTNGLYTGTITFTAS